MIQYCNNCGHRMIGRSEGECCNKCLFYDEIWDEVD